MMKIARIALALGLVASVSSQVYAAGLVQNDNELRNDLAWLSDRGVIHLSLSTAAQSGRNHSSVEKSKTFIFL